MHAGIYDDGDRSRRSDWFDSGHGDDDDAAGQADEACSRQEWFANDSSAC